MQTLNYIQWPALLPDVTIFNTVELNFFFF